MTDPLPLLPSGIDAFLHTKGAVIKALREKLGLTQTELGDMCSLSQSRLSLAENADAKISTPTLMLMADHLLTDLKSIAHVHIQMPDEASSIRTAMRLIITALLQNSVPKDSDVKSFFMNQWENSEFELTVRLSRLEQQTLWSILAANNWIDLHSDGTASVASSGVVGLNTALAYLEALLSRRLAFLVGISGLREDAGKNHPELLDEVPSIAFVREQLTERLERLRLSIPIGSTDTAEYLDNVLACDLIFCYGDVALAKMIADCHERLRTVYDYWQACVDTEHSTRKGLELARTAMWLARRDNLFFIQEMTNREPAQAAQLMLEWMLYRPDIVNNSVGFVTWGAMSILGDLSEQLHTHQAALFQSQAISPQFRQWLEDTVAGTDSVITEELG